MAQYLRCIISAQCLGVIIILTNLEINYPTVGIKYNWFTHTGLAHLTGWYLPNSWDTKDHNQRTHYPQDEFFLAAKCWLKLQGNYSVSGKGNPSLQGVSKGQHLHLECVDGLGESTISAVIEHRKSPLPHLPDSHWFLIYTTCVLNSLFPSPKVFNRSVPHLGDENLKLVVITSMRNFISKAC